jgi:drug/metabolite transporter (DMT)-like permease
VNRLTTPQLFVLAVLIWGTTWHAIVYQLAVGTPELGVTLRFALAGAVALVFARWQGVPLALPWRQHGRLALQGAFMYSLSYLCVYHAELHVPSGLVAVGYSASPLLSGLAAFWLWGTPVSRRFLAGGALGMLGVALIFWPELAASQARPTAGWGLVFTVGAVLLSTVGSLSASRNGTHALPFWVSLGWSMVYGAALSGLVMAVQGQGLPAWPTAASWWWSLAYLAGAGSLLAFGAFLTLQQRIGPGRAATIGVMTPVVALAVSTVFEGYRPNAYTAAGALAAVVGNWWMLKRA